MLSVTNKKGINVINIMYNNFMNNVGLKKSKSMGNLLKKSSNDQLLKTFAMSYDNKLLL